MPCDSEEVEACRCGLVRRFRSFSARERVQKVDDLLLSGGSRVELAAHLCEAAVELIAEAGEIFAQINEIFSKRVEAGRRRLPKIAEFTPDLTDVSIGGTGQHTCRRGIALAGPEAPGQVAHLMLESAHPRFEIPSLHAPKPTG